ncbi:PREDICTED: sphingomyelin phosphodiesterase-like [Nicrophorus vespilloides]|uniref:Sphingomyelin phosphodiesterase n=1 Tax=Nicrophorus vespilloides TaxID=110193 RepID=A0ABM1MLQ3_NICVS|nr:PREDICTED: sphingomyelin phosphodiesterase-like [Nicrophorus vespilloides]
MGFQISNSILLITCGLAVYSVQTPIQTEVIDFDDPWDYKVAPHNQALLSSEGNHHSLTSTLRMSKNQDLFGDDEETLQDLGADHSSLTGRLTCATCRLGVSLLKSEVDKDGTFEEIKEKFVSICVGFRIETEPVCNGVYDIYGPVVLPALKMTKLNSEQICKMFMEERCGDVENPLHDWTVDLRNEGSEKGIWDSPLPKEDAPTFKVLQLSDTHFDPDYTEGSPANCQEPLCCRNYSTPTEKVEVQRAGKWGTFGKCDTPQVLFEAMLSHIARQHPDIDYVIWTGDIPPHDIWNQTKEQNIDNIRFTIGKLFETFPNIPIFPALGNHEGIPAGNFPPPWIKSKDQSIDWLYEEVSKEWSKWLPSEVNETLSHGGFYSVLIRPKFRLISLNMNYCYSLSWWLFLNSTDPAKELKWLVHELDLAEEKSEKVHIIGHVPPGASDCLKMWSKNYYDIINRYRDTVVAQFFGHTHNDEFEVFYMDNKTEQASGIAYIGPVVTTYEYLNPAYRIYYVDADTDNPTREVIDHETWIMDLVRSNSNPDSEPIWRKLYSARSAYGMTSLRPAEWSKLIERILQDSKLFDRFYRYFYAGSPARPKCDTAKCKLDIICGLKSGKSHEVESLCRREKAFLSDE